MKQHFPLILAAFIIATLVVSTVSLFMSPADAFREIVNALTENPGDTSQKFASLHQ